MIIHEENTLDNKFLQFLQRIFRQRCIPTTITAIGISQSSINVMTLLTEALSKAPSQQSMNIMMRPKTLPAAEMIVAASTPR